MELKIYEIPHEMRLALENVVVDEETGEIIGMDKVDAIVESATKKIANVARYIREMEHQIEGMKEAKANIDKRIKTAQKLVDWLKVRSVQAMIAIDERKIEEPDIKVSTRKSESVSLDDESLLDKKFVKVEVITKQSPDKKAIKEAIKAGEEVKGAHLCTNYSLQIK